MGDTMTTPAIPDVNPIALKQGEGEALWFSGALTILKATSETTAGRVTVMEHLAPKGSGPPVHVHHREDEWFFIMEGELTFWVGGRIIEAKTGSFVYGPRDIPHTFTVTSPQAHSIVVTEPAGFEKFMRAVGEPATTLTIPPASVSLPSRDRILAAAAECGLEILGPPGIPS
jgi:mannose-6-phosphate isomerase-like protein (cupin superfamily)